ncbi:hypothetical protein OKW39_003276 [Paraburkholderia sp. MM6662-R1]
MDAIIVGNVPRVPWNKDKLTRAEVAAEAQEDLGHSDSPAIGGENP